MKKYPLESPITALNVRIGEHDGNVRRASDNVIAVVFSARSTPALSIGSRIPVRFLGGGMVNGKEAFARVMSWHDQGEYRQVQLKIAADIFCLVCAGMGMRDDFRVTPNASERTAVLLRARGHTEWRRALLKDISVSGIGVLVGSETDELLINSTMVEVEIELPGETEPTQFVGCIRYRGISGCSVKHGIEVESGLTPGYLDVEARIRDYIMRRQREILRASRGLEHGPSAA